MSQRKGSITPETIRRKFLKTPVASELLEVRELRSTIPESELLTDVARKERLQEFLKHIELYNAFLSTHKDLELYLDVDYTSLTSEVMRFGINTDSLNGDISTELTKIFIETGAVSVSHASSASARSNSKDYPHILHPLEVLRIKSAADFVIDTKQKAVLVDIFARNDNGSIKLESDGIPEIHTILLYMPPSASEKKVLVIDPNNSTFSKHLTYNKDMIFGWDSEIEILAPRRTTQIYLPPEEKSGLVTGPLPAQHRDCTDIAVKLGFALSEYDEQVSGPINIHKLKDVQVIREISNNYKFDTRIFYKGKEDSARICQATESDVRKEAKKFIVGLGIFADTIIRDCRKGEEGEAVKKAVIGTLNISHSEPDGYLDDLQRLRVLYDETVELAGKLALEV